MHVTCRNMAPLQTPRYQGDWYDVLQKCRENIPEASQGAAVEAQHLGGGCRAEQPRVVEALPELVAGVVVRIGDVVPGEGLPIRAARCCGICAHL